VQGSIHKFKAKKYASSKLDQGEEQNDFIAGKFRVVTEPSLYDEILRQKPVNLIPALESTRNEG
jgi:hypothetical protein